jgi:hypothetical protein
VSAPSAKGINRAFLEANLPTPDPSAQRTVPLSPELSAHCVHAFGSGPEAAKALRLKDPAHWTMILTQDPTFVDDPLSAITCEMHNDPLWETQNGSGADVSLAFLADPAQAESACRIFTGCATAPEGFTVVVVSNDPIPGADAWVKSRVATWSD